MSSIYNMTREQIKDLLERHESNQLSKDEQDILDTWYLKLGQSEKFKIDEAEINSRLNAVLLKLEVSKKQSRLRRSRLTVAAAAILIISLSVFLYTYKSNNHPKQVSQLANDIAPGGNKAFLTLADGKRITITDVKNGEIAEQSGVKITKAADGQLIYTVSNPSGNNNNGIAFNTIETPNGGQYQVKLPDGTKVWLNAASTLRFPSSFARLVNRRVELLSGEAYFEVAKDKKHPFIVKTDQQEVEVLGTHFNINNYSDESSVKTTLLEGSVKISVNGTSNNILLRPGQQSILKNHKIDITKVYAADIIAWKSGKFVFNSQDMVGLMRQVARWYDVDIIYVDNVEDVKISGKVSRFANISTLLDKLEKTGSVGFKLSGRTVTLTKKER